MKEKDDILAKTDGGLDIFVHYLGKECLRKKFRSHMREDDKHPSCKLYRNQALDGGPTTICMILAIVAFPEIAFSWLRRF